MYRINESAFDATGDPFHDDYESVRWRGEKAGKFLLILKGT